jgi:hypothetical protein
MGSLAVVCFGSVEQALGVASLAVGDPDRAALHLRRAVAHNEAIGHWPAVIWSKARLAQALALGGDVDDRAAARAVAAEAATDAAAAGIALPVPVRTPAGAARRPRHAECTRQGRRWRIAVGDRFAVVENSVGLQHLATLIANPGVDIPAVQLAAGDGSAHEDGTSQRVLDDTAVRQFRSRLHTLREQIDEAETLGHADRVARLRSESDWLVDELQAQAGLGGRSREFADRAERARIAVGKAIRRALRRISAADPVIGAQLLAAVQTGTTCCYCPAVAGIIGGDGPAP